MGEQDSGLFWGESYATEMHVAKLTDIEKQLRDRFVTEYLKDGDRVLAAVRCGFGRGYAAQYADQFWDEPYVQIRISEMQRTAPVSEDELAKEHRALVLSVLTDAAQNGPYASRVAAAREISAMYGWNKPDTNSNEAELMAEALREFAQVAPV